MRVIKKVLAAVLTAAVALSLFTGTVLTAHAAPALDGHTVKAATDSSYSTVLGKSVTNTYAGQLSNVYTYGASGFSANFTGTDFWMYVPDMPYWDNNYVTESIMVLVDTDMPMEATKINLTQPGWVCLASGLEEGVPHSITMYKQSRGFYGFMASQWLAVSHIATDGSFNTPDEVSDLVIEVYGDSITNGDAVWLNEDGSNSAYTYGSYSAVVGRLLGAESRICGNTGNGLKAWCFANSSNLQHENLLPPQDSWDIFDPNYRDSAWSHSGDDAADVVIINLGTNDNADHGVDLSRKAFADEYVRFIKQIKTDCPDAIVICTLGAMGAVETWGPCIGGDGSDYYAYSYTRLIKDGNRIRTETVSDYVEASRKNDFLNVIASHTATPTGANGTYTVADYDAVGEDVVVVADSLVIDAQPSHDDNVVQQCNAWAGEQFVYWVELEKCNNIVGGPGYDNGHPSNVAHEIYALEIATLINDVLDLGVDLYPTEEEEEDLNLTFGNSYSSSSKYDDSKDAPAAFDGNASTYWQAEGEATSEQWIQIGYSEEVELNKVVLTWNSIYPDGECRIEYSDNGTDWNVAKTFTVGNTNDTVLTFDAITAKYLRLAVNGSSYDEDKYMPELISFEAYMAEVETANDISKTGAQMANDDGGRVRLLAAVGDPSAYSKVGFEVTVSDNSHSGTNTNVYLDKYVYNSIAGVTAEDAGVDADGKMFALTVTDMPKNAVLTVRAIAVSLDGETTVYGDETVIAITNGVMTVRK